MATSGAVSLAFVKPVPGFGHVTDNRGGTLYRLTNQQNGKTYIGVTTGSLRRRLQRHVVTAVGGNSQYLIHRAIRKYGADAFKMEALGQFPSLVELLAAERGAIAEQMPAYNLTKGGEGAWGVKHSKESVERVAAAHRGKPSHMLGKKHTPEARRKMSAALKGKPSPNKGKPMLPQVRAALMAAKGTYRCVGSPPDVFLARMAGHNQARRRPVICLNDGQTFASVTAAAKNYGFTKSGVSRVCLGLRRQCSGHRFAFAEP